MRHSRFFSVASATILISSAVTLVAGPVAATPADVVTSNSESAGIDATGRSAETRWLGFEQQLPRETAKQLAELASESDPLMLAFRSGAWQGWVRVSSDDSKVLDEFLASSPAAAGERPLSAVEVSPEALERVRTVTAQTAAAQYDPRVGSAIADGSYEYDPSTTGCRQTLDNVRPTFPPDWTPNTPTAGRLQQIRMQGLIESTTHTFTGVGNEDGQWPCVRRLIDGTQGQGYQLTSALAYEHDYKLNQCDQAPYIEASSDYSATTDIPLSYIDTRASDSGCDIDFTIGTVAPFLMDKSATYSISTQTDADGTVATAQRARARLTGEVLNVDGVGCRLSEFPAGVITTDEGEPWCVNVTLPFQPREAISYIAIPDFVVKYDGTCYDWTRGEGYRWCGPGADPN